MDLNKEYAYELQIQAAGWQNIWQDFPETRRLLFAVPNGGRRDKMDVMQLKASGLVPGIPDLIFVWQKKVYGLEGKTTTGILSSEQIKVHEAWGPHVEAVYIWRSALELYNIVKKIIGK